MDKISEVRLREYVNNESYLAYKKHGCDDGEYTRWFYVHCMDIENMLNELDELRKEIAYMQYVND